MHAHLFPRLLLVALTAAVISSGLLASSASADTISRTETSSGEGVYVQNCYWFNITTSFTTTRTIHMISSATGGPVAEQTNVRFAGTLAIDATSQSLPYEGKFTRISDSRRNSITIRDFDLRLQLPAAEEVVINFEQRELDLPADPPAVLRTVAYTELGSSVCMLLLSGKSVTRVEVVANVHTENSALPRVTVAVDEMTPWTELDACDTSPPGQGC